MWPFRKRLPGMSSTPPCQHDWKVASVSFTKPYERREEYTLNYDERALEFKRCQGARGGRTHVALRCMKCGSLQSQSLSGIHSQIVEEVV